MRLTETKDYKVTCNLGSPIQTGWVVTNLEVAMNSFEEIFRIIDWKLAEWPDPLRPEIVSLHRGKIATGWRSRMAFATIGSAAIELVENLAGESAYSEWLEKKGSGIHHQMYAVDDVSAVISEFSSLGIGVLTCCGTRQNDEFSPKWAVLDTEKLLGINTEVIVQDGIAS